MKINIPGKHYRVGGAVRDLLLGYPHDEIDYVVVGTTPEAMLAAGFTPVGKSFPVFLHPGDKSEYALARSERKIGKGYHGFECHAGTEVTLEEDLKRRDLTINAMAMDEDGTLIDPYGGKKDLLEHKLLRHVSEAFVEDPVRILRAARFAARFAHLGFTIAPETMALMHEMVANGEVNALVPERVWKETERAFTEQNPEVYIEVLKTCGALKVLFPELDAVLDKKDRITHLKNACLITSNPAIRFTVLMAGVHISGHAIPADWQALMAMLTDNQIDLSATQELPAEHLVELLHGLDAFRRPARFEDFLIAVEAVYGKSDADYLRSAFNAASQVDIRPLMQHLKGLEIKKAIEKARAQAVDEWMKSR